MGVDVNLYVEGEVSQERLLRANETFKDRCPIADEYVRDDGALAWTALAADNSEWRPRPRIVANVTCRYWGPGYERGDWPSIYGAIRWMQALFPEFKVYYGGDSSDDGEECTEELLTEFWEHYLGPSGDNYRQLMNRVISPAPGCDGSGSCTARLHVHGCFADADGSRCDDAEHTPLSPADGRDEGGSEPKG